MPELVAGTNVELRLEGDDLFIDFTGGGPAHIPVTPYEPTPYVLDAGLSRASGFINATNSYTLTVSGDPRFVIVGIAVTPARDITPPAGFTLIETTAHPTASGFEVCWYSGIASAGSHVFTWTGNSTGVAFRIQANADAITEVVNYETGTGTNNQDGRTQPVEVDTTDGTVGFWLCFTTKTAAVPDSSVVPNAAFWTLEPPATSTWAGVGRTGTGGAQLLAEGLQLVQSPYLSPGEGNTITGWFVIRLASGERPAPAQTFATAIESALEDAMGYAFIVLKDGEEIDSGANGVIRIASSAYPAQPATLDAAWSVQSISKLVMRLATFALIEDEAFDLDTPFSTITGSRFATYGTNVDAITIEDLLTMRSGMTISESLLSFDGQLSSALTGTANAEHIGARYYYQNGVYGVLQAAIEEASGMPYRAFLEARILGPIGVPTRFASPDAYPGQLYEDDSATSGADLPAFTYFGAQGLWMSVREMAQLAKALRSDVILQPETVRTALAYTLDTLSYSTSRGMFLTANGFYVSGARSVRAYVFRGPDGYDVVLVYSGADGVARQVVDALADA